MMTGTSTLPNPASFVEHKQLRFLIFDSPTESNLPLYLAEMQKFGVKFVVRVCEPTYADDQLTNEGIQVLDMPFTDGEAPPSGVIDKWLDLVEKVLAGAGDAAPTIGVHCVAGLGRAPVLVAVALVEQGMEPLDAVGFLRKKRRGAINKKQLSFLETYKPRRKKDKCVVM